MVFVGKTAKVDCTLSLLLIQSTSFILTSTAWNVTVFLISDSEWSIMESLILTASQFWTLSCSQWQTERCFYILCILKCMFTIIHKNKLQIIVMGLILSRQYRLNFPRIFLDAVPLQLSFLSWRIIFESVLEDDIRLIGRTNLSLLLLTVADRIKYFVEHSNSCHGAQEGKHSCLITQ